MAMCDGCIHKNVCGEEGAFDEALVNCADYIATSNTTVIRRKMIYADTFLKLYNESKNLADSMGYAVDVESIIDSIPDVSGM